MIYPTGALLIAPDGTAYRAREPREDLFSDALVQDLSVDHVDGTVGVISGDKLPDGVRVLWEPSGIALPVDADSFAEDQERIRLALALVDDLVQEAGDLGDNGLMRTLADAYHAIERFRILPGRSAQ